MVQMRRRAMTARRIGFLTALFLAAGIAAAAQSDSREPMDTNGDGRVSRTEWRGRPQAFDGYDWNNDGVLSGDEVRSAELDRRRFDRSRGWNNGNEWTTAFADFDRDHD